MHRLELKYLKISDSHSRGNLKVLTAYKKEIAYIVDLR